MRLMKWNERNIPHKKKNTRPLFFEKPNVLKILL